MRLHNKIAAEKNKRNDGLVYGLFYTLNIKNSDDMEWTDTNPVYFFRQSARERPETLSAIPYKNYEDFLDLSNDRRFIEKLSRLGEKLPDVLLYAGEAFRREGDYKEALKLSDIALELAPGYPPTHFYRALLHLTMDNYTKASESIREANRFKEIISVEALSRYFPLQIHNKSD